MMIDTLIDLAMAPLRYPFMQRAFIEVILVGVLCGAIGSFVVLRGLAFIGDALAHGVLPGIAGLAEVASAPYPDPTQFDRASDYYDPKARRDAPRWYLVDVRAHRKTRLIGIAELRASRPLSGMQILKRGNRLSITPVAKGEWKYITTRLIEPAK